MIPVNQLTNSNEQLVQTLAALNNSAASLNNIQMQSMQLPAQQSGSGRFFLYKNNVSQITLLAPLQVPAAF